MSSHDCVVRGQVVLVVGTQMDKIKEALADFVTCVSEDFDELAGDGHSIVLEGDVLHLHVAMQRWGGPENEKVADLASALGNLCREPGHVELLDFDTGDDSEHCCPYFFGRTEEEKLVARLQYGVQQMAVWTEDLIAPEFMVEIERFIRAQSRLAKPKQKFSAHLAFGAEHLEFDFEVPGEAPAVMLDAECLAAFVQKAELTYLPY